MKKTFKLLGIVIGIGLLTKAVKIVEDVAITKMIEKRDKNDDGSRYTSEDIMKVRKQSNLSNEDCSQINDNHETIDFQENYGVIKLDS